MINNANFNRRSADLFTAMLGFLDIQDVGMGLWKVHFSVGPKYDWILGQVVSQQDCQLAKGKTTRARD